MVNLPFPWRKKEQLGPEVPVVLLDLVVLPASSPSVSTVSPRSS